MGYIFKQVPVPTGVWTDITAPVAAGGRSGGCIGFSLKSSVGQPLRERTDKTDATTEDTLPVGSQEGVIVTDEQGYGVIRFAPGQVIISVQPPGATPDTAICKFVR